MKRSSVRFRQAAPSPWTRSISACFLVMKRSSVRFRQAAPTIWTMSISACFLVMERSSVRFRQAAPTTLDDVGQRVLPRHGKVVGSIPTSGSNKSGRCRSARASSSWKGRRFDSDKRLHLLGRGRSARASPSWKGRRFVDLPRESKRASIDGHFQPRSGRSCSSARRVRRVRFVERRPSSSRFERTRRSRCVAESRSLGRFPRCADRRLWICTRRSGQFLVQPHPRRWRHRTIGRPAALRSWAGSKLGRDRGAFSNWLRDIPLRSTFHDSGS